MSNVEIAVASFSEGFSCSQAVLSAFAPGLGLDRPTALRVAAALAAAWRERARLAAQLLAL